MILKAFLGVLAIVSLAGCEGYSAGGFYGEGPEVGVEQPDVIVTGGYGGYDNGYHHNHGYYGGHVHGNAYHQSYSHGVGNQMHGQTHQGSHAQHGGHGQGHK